MFKLHRDKFSSLDSQPIPFIHPKRERLIATWIRVGGKLVCEWRLEQVTAECSTVEQRKLYCQLELIDES